MNRSTYLGLILQLLINFVSFKTSVFIKAHPCNKCRQITLEVPILTSASANRGSIVFYAHRIHFNKSLQEWYTRYLIWVWFVWSCKKKCLDFRTKIKITVYFEYFKRRHCHGETSRTKFRSPSFRFWDFPLFSRFHILARSFALHEDFYS